MQAASSGVFLSVGVIRKAFLFKKVANRQLLSGMAKGRVPLARMALFGRRP